MSKAAPFLTDEQLLSIFSLTKTATAIHIGEDAIIQTANDAMLRIWGKDKSVIGKPLGVALPELEGQPFLAMFKKVWLEGLTISGTDTPAELVVDGKKQIFYFEFEYRAVKNEKGETICILHSAMDVTDRVAGREAQERAKEKEEALAREQTLNEELSASNEELSSVNDELMLVNDQLALSEQKLSDANTELEDRVRRRTESLAESEARFRDMVEQSPVPMLVTMGKNMIFELINQPMLDLIGRDERVMGLSWNQAMPELVGQGIIDRLLETYRNGREWKGIEVPIVIEKDNILQHGFYNISYKPLIRNGQTVGVLQSAINVTEVVKARQLLEESLNEQQAINEELAASNEELATVNEELEITNEKLVVTQDDLQTLVIELAGSDARFRSLVQQAPVAIFLLRGREQRIEVMNDLMLKMLGKSSEIIGKTFSEALPEFEGQAFVQLIDDVLTSGQPFYGNEVLAKTEHEGIIRDGYSNFIYEPIKDEAGHTNSVMCVSIDVTELVLSRKAIEQVGESLRMAIDAADAGTFSINAKTFDFSASPRLMELFGFEPGENMPFEACINQVRADYRPTVQAGVEAAVYRGERFEMEFPVISHRDDKERWVRGLGTLQQGNDTANSFFTGVFIDITERRADEQRKNDFIGMVSHELKTPLTTVTAYVQMLLGKARKNEDAFSANSLEKANAQLKKMAAMINGFLNISRLESGKIMIDKQEFELNTLIGETIDEMADTGSPKQLHFKPCPPVIVNADRDKIGSVISNLLSNAAKYSPKDSFIDVKCVIAENEAIVTVIDEGMGIRPEDIDRLFDRYYRVDSPNTKHISGFGIGLYLSAEIIKRHGGRIWADSTPGKGSAFHFAIPV